MNRCNTKPGIFQAHSVLGGRDYHVDTTSGIRLLQWNCAIAGHRSSATIAMMISLSQRNERAKKYISKS
jgi:hypothetical protein